MFEDADKILEEAQKELNELYEEKGLTDKILDAQLKINRIRHITNKSDPTKRQYKNFVQ